MLTKKSCLFSRFFLRRFRDLICVTRISNWVPRIRENHHRAPKIRENRVLRIREIRSLQIHTWYLTFSLKKTLLFSIQHTRLYSHHFSSLICSLLRIPNAGILHLQYSNQPLPTKLLFCMQHVLLHFFLDSLHTWMLYHVDDTYKCSCVHNSNQQLPCCPS